MAENVESQSVMCLWSQESFVTPDDRWKEAQQTVPSTCEAQISRLGDLMHQRDRLGKVSFEVPELPQNAREWEKRPTCGKLAGS